MTKTVKTEGGPATFWSAGGGEPTRVILACSPDNPQCESAARLAERLKSIRIAAIYEATELPESVKEAATAVARIAEAHAGETVLIVGRANINRLLICHWLGIPIKRCGQIDQAEGALNIAVFTGNRVVLETVNDVCHLLQPRKMSS